MVHLAPPWTSLKALNIHKSLQGSPSLSTAATWYTWYSQCVWGKLAVSEHYPREKLSEPVHSEKHDSSSLPGSNPAGSSGRQEKVENVEETLLLTCCVPPSCLLFSWFVDNVTRTLGDLCVSLVRDSFFCLNWAFTDTEHSYNKLLKVQHNDCLLFVISPKLFESFSLYIYTIKLIAHLSEQPCSIFYIFSQLEQRGYCQASSNIMTF